MKTTVISDNLDALLRQPDVRSAVKDKFFTQRLFIDTAVRKELRRMGFDTEPELVAHLERLAVSKSRHLDKQKVAHQLRRAKDRTRKAHEKIHEAVHEEE